MYCDVAIVGGGPAGSTTACVLAAAGVRVLLVNSGTGGHRLVGESLAPVARPYLARIGAWEAFLADGHLPCYGNESAWGSNTLGSTDFIRSPHGHGWHIDRPRFDACLRATARAAGVTVCDQTTVRSFESMSGEWVLQLDGPAGATPATCRWLVDATGRRSFIARRLGIAREDNDRLLAFAATFRPTTPGDVDSLSFVESAADGWWYTALMPSGERVVVFFTDADEPAAVAAKSGSGFLAALATTRHVSQRVARFGYEMTGFPRGLDARSSRLERFHGPGWVAVGDAAVSFDPLSSQGLVAALDAGTKAGQALATELRDGAAMLGQYAEESAKGYQAFLDQRRRYYGYETRWSDRPFWERRQQSVKDINDSYR